VNVVIIFPPSSFDNETSEERKRIHTALRVCAEQAGLTGDVVLVWQDQHGTTKFIAPPQQHPFFQILKFEQLYAQVNHTITC
jgi:hypothetical protein